MISWEHSLQTGSAAGPSLRWLLLSVHVDAKRDFSLSIRENFDGRMEGQPRARFSYHWIGNSRNVLWKLLHNRETTSETNNAPTNNRELALDSAPINLCALCANDDFRLTKKNIKTTTDTNVLLLPSIAMWMREIHGTGSIFELHGWCRGGRKLGTNTNMLITDMLEKFSECEESYKVCCDCGLFHCYYDHFHVTIFMLISSKHLYSFQFFRIFIFR